MVIPKQHYRWVYDDPNRVAYWEFANQVLDKLKIKLKPEYLTFLTMGNEVPHAHIHILPRYENDNLVGLYKESLRSDTTTDQLKDIVVKINS